MSESGIEPAGGYAASSPKREKFVRLAESRTVKAIKAIRTIAKLDNRSAYEYDETDVDKIAKALGDEVEALRTRMQARKSSGGVGFTL